MLYKIRELIAKRNFSPEYVGEAEVLGCDIYDMIKDEFDKKYHIQKRIITDCETGEKVKDIPRRDDKVRNIISISVKDAEIGDEIFVKLSDFDGGNYQFAAYMHPLCKSHSKIKTQFVGNGWIITKIGVN